MGEKRAVVYTVDGDLDCKLQMLTSIESVRTFLGKIDVIVLTTEESPSYQGYLGIKTVNVNKYIQDFGLDKTGIVWRRHPVSPMLLFRLIIPVVKELQSYDKVLYLDSDTEIWRSEFGQIFDIDDEGHEVTAVRDSLANPRVVLRMLAAKTRAPIDSYEFYQRWDEVEKHKGYVNSGVIIFNMTKLRNWSDRARAIIEQLCKRRPSYPDQDILNAYYDIFLIVDRRYNDWRQLTTNDSYLRHNVGNARRRAPVYPPRHNTRPDDKLSSPVCHAYVITEDKRSALKDVLKPRFRTELVRLFQTPFAGLLDLLGVPSDIRQKDHLANWFGHYRACKLAMASGYRKILIAENDWVIDESALDTLPTDCDVAVFDGAVNDDGRTLNTWVACDADHQVAARSSKAYVLSRRAMESLVWLFESLMDPKIPDRRIRYIHKWLTPKAMRGKLRMYYWSK